MEHDQQLDDGFPRYMDGDVYIILAHDKIFQLHSSVLRRNSQTLACRFLNERNGAQLTRKAIKEGVVIRYCLELAPTATEHFRLLQVDDRGDIAYTGSLLPSIDNGKLPAELPLHYEHIFRAYYNHHFEMHDENIAAILRQAMGLVEVAEYLQSVRVVSKHIDVALLSQGQVLYRSISSNAVAWAGLAQRLQSDCIFKEAIVHLVGQWSGLNQKLKQSMAPEVAELCDAKNTELNLKKRAIELRIFGHYPGDIQRAQDSKNIGRASYSNDIISWMALSLFRHWMGQTVCNDQNHHAPDGGYAFYKQLKEGGQSYLDKDTVAAFHQYFPMSEKCQRVLENHLNAVKEEVKHFVQPLFANNSQLEVEKYPVKYLTCAGLNMKEDLPWHRKIQVAPEANMLRVRNGPFEEDAEGDDEF